METEDDITGDEIKSKANSDAYRNSPLWDNLEKKHEVEMDEVLTLAAQNVMEAARRYRALYEERNPGEQPVIFITDNQQGDSVFMANRFNSDLIKMRMKLV